MWVLNPEKEIIALAIGNFGQNLSLFLNRNTLPEQPLCPQFLRMYPKIVHQYTQHNRNPNLIHFLHP
jgi:hypothetical protein